MTQIQENAEATQVQHNVLYKPTEHIGAHLMSLITNLRGQIQVLDERFKKYRLKKTKKELETLIHYDVVLVESMKIVREVIPIEDDFIKQVFLAGYIAAQAEGALPADEAFNAFNQEKLVRYVVKEEDSLIETEEGKEKEDETEATLS